MYSLGTEKQKFISHIQYLADQQGGVEFIDEQKAFA